MPERAITEMNSKQVNETTIRLNAFMRDVKDGNLRTILKNMQSMLDYHAEKIRIYEEHLSELTGKARRLRNVFSVNSPNLCRQPFR